MWSGGFPAADRERRFPTAELQSNDSPEKCGRLEIRCSAQSSYGIDPFCSKGYPDSPL